MYIPGPETKTFGNEMLSRLPESIKREWQIGIFLEQAINATNQDIAAVTKEIAAHPDMNRPLDTIRIECAARGDCNKPGSLYSTVLLDFVTEAYLNLSNHFGGEEWGEWYILPYFAIGDDTNETFCVGVFADRMPETVVE